MLIVVVCLLLMLCCLVSVCGARWLMFAVCLVFVGCCLLDLVRSVLCLSFVAFVVWCVSCQSIVTCRI